MSEQPEMRLLPVTPTPEIIEAMERAAWDDYNSMPAIKAMSKAYAAALSAAPQPEDLIERIDDEWRALFGDGPDSFANPATIHYDEFKSAMLAVAALSDTAGSDDRP